MGGIPGHQETKPGIIEETRIHSIVFAVEHVRNRAFASDYSRYYYRIPAAAPDVGIRNKSRRLAIPILFVVPVKLVEPGRLIIIDGRRRSRQFPVEPDVEQVSAPGVLRRRRIGCVDDSTMLYKTASPDTVPFPTRAELHDPERLDVIESLRFAPVISAPLIRLHAADIGHIGEQASLSERLL